MVAQVAAIRYKAQYKSPLSLPRGVESKIRNAPGRKATIEWWWMQEYQRPAPAILPYSVVETRQTLVLKSKVRILVWQPINKHKFT